MPMCIFIKDDGARCRAHAMRDSQWCYTHSPQLAERRKRTNSKGGKSGGRGRPRGGKELASIKSQLQELAYEVKSGQMQRADAAVVGQILNVLLRALETERKWHELGELEERLRALEARSELPRKQRRY